MSKTSTLYLKNAIVFTAKGFLKANVEITDGIITSIDGLSSNKLGKNCLDCTDLYVLPCFVDLHCHIRDPGNQDAEDISSATQAAALGGYGAILMMPNTNPTIDSLAVVNYLQLKIQKEAAVDVAVSGAITLGRKGEVLAPLAQLREAGITFFTDDGNCLENSHLLKTAMKTAYAYDLVIAQHLEDSKLKANGVINEGKYSLITGLSGIDPVGEVAMLFRDLLLAKRYCASYHAQHVTLSDSVELIKHFKKESSRITCEVTPHHLYFDESVVESFNSVYKVNPPLRAHYDVNALRQALLKGLIDIVATDHAPHLNSEKEKPFAQAPFGMLGLQTAFSAVLTSLFNMAELETILKVIVKTFSVNPAKILRLDNFGVPIEVGTQANLTIVNPLDRKIFEHSKIVSKAKNSPFVGETLYGSVEHLIYKGRLLVKEGKLQ
jgi:dihydroorotase